MEQVRIRRVLYWVSIRLLTDWISDISASGLISVFALQYMHDGKGGCV